MKNKLLLSIVALLLSFFSLNAQETTKEISRNWTSFTQTIEISSEKKKKVKLTGDVKVDTESNSSWAGLWMRVDNHNKELGFFDNMGDRPIRINEWKNYTVEGTIDENTKSINFGGLVLYNGKFYFDNVKLFIENDNGIMQEYMLPNSDFEQTIVNNKIPGWNEAVSKGVTIRIKEFDVTSHKEEDNQSLLITGSNITEPQPSSIGDPKSEAPQIAAMISMLEDLKSRVEYTVKNLKKEHVDHLHDEKANRIGALIMHLAAAEVYYQVSTFENRGFNEEEKKKWLVALDLGPKARTQFKDKEIDYYLNIYNEVRKKTIKLLKERDDEWFTSVNEGSWGTNQYQWFHVMEHQSSHLGQILFLKKRLPPINPVDLEEKIKN